MFTAMLILVFILVVLPIAYWIISSIVKGFRGPTRPR
jgi:hypothetical protein